MKRSLLALLLLVASTSAFAGAHIVIVNGDGAGVGLNDPTPATPVGGNPGTTVGQQRINVFQHAADTWGKIINSNVDIIVNASFKVLDCTSSGAILGSTGVGKVFRNFENAPQQDVWYPVALANKFAGHDLFGGSPQILMSYNSRLDEPTCLGGVGFYYGYDGNEGNKTDLLEVILHEMAHGLGFSGVYRSGDGTLLNGFPSVFEQHILDLQSGLRWSQMTNEQRINSSTNDQTVVWDGSSATTAAIKVLGPTPVLRITAPASLARTYRMNAASFGPKITIVGVNGIVVPATDVAEPADASNPAGTTTDGCSPFSNAPGLLGRIALVDRGRCNFTVKARNAQDAGAIAVIVADGGPNSTGPNSLPPMGGSDPLVTIPAVGITLADGAAIRAAFPLAINALILADPLVLAGADASGHPKLFMPTTFQGGSSIYHWDVSASPNLLMEPAINGDLPADGVDITINQLIDIGWSQSSDSGGTPTPSTGRRILKRGGH